VDVAQSGSCSLTTRGARGVRTTRFDPYPPQLSHAPTYTLYNHQRHTPQTKPPTQEHYTFTQQQQNIPYIRTWSVRVPASRSACAAASTSAGVISCDDVVATTAPPPPRPWGAPPPPLTPSIFGVRVYTHTHTHTQCTRSLSLHTHTHTRECVRRERALVARGWSGCMVGNLHMYNTLSQSVRAGGSRNPLTVEIFNGYD